MPQWFLSFTSWFFNPLSRLAKWFWKAIMFFVPYFFALIFVASACFGIYAVYKVNQVRRTNEMNSYINAGAQQALNNICQNKSMTISGKTFTCK